MSNKCCPLRHVAHIILSVTLSPITDENRQQGKYEIAWVQCTFEQQIQ